MDKRTGTELAAFLAARADALAAEIRGQSPAAGTEPIEQVFREWFDSQLGRLRQSTGNTNDWAVSLVDWVRAQNAGPELIMEQSRIFRDLFIEHCRASKDLATKLEIEALAIEIGDWQCRLLTAYWAQIERETRASERRRQRAIAEAMGSAFVTLTPEGLIDIANGHFAKLIGYAAEDLAGRELAAFCDEAAALEVRRCLRQRRAAGNRVFNGQLITANERRLPLAFVVQPIFDEQGLRDGVAILMEDPKSLNHEENDFLGIVAENIIQFVPVAVQVFNRNRRILYHNKKYQEIFGEEDLGDTPLCCRFLAPEKEGDACVCEQVFQTGEFYFGNTQCYLTNERHMFRVLIAPIPEANGEITRVVCAMRDISSQKNLENRMLEQQRTSLASQVAMTVAHQLRNPLAVVIGFTEMLAKGLPPDQIPAAVDKMLRNGLRCKEIVEDLLEFGQGFPGEHVMADVGKLVREFVEPLIPASKNRRIDWQLPGAPLWVECVPNQLAQVFLNLIDNALHFALNRVEFQLCLEGEWIKVRVADDGPGVPEELRPRIFQPFFTTRREDGGVGLGLSLSQSVVNEYGGNLHLAPAGQNKSSQVPGACFIVELPVVNESRQTDPNPNPIESALEIGKRLLVVDDESDLCEMLEMILEMRGHHVDTTGTAADAMNLLKRNRYDALVLDVQLPGDMNGPQLFEYLQTAYPDLANHTLFITADTMNFETRRFLDRVKRPSMEKPFLVHDFVTAVNRLIEKK